MEAPILPTPQSPSLSNVACVLGSEVRSFSPAAQMPFVNVIQRPLNLEREGTAQSPSVPRLLPGQAQGPGAGGSLGPCTSEGDPGWVEHPRDVGVLQTHAVFFISGMTELFYFRKKNIYI